MAWVLDHIIEIITIIIRRHRHFVLEIFSLGSNEVQFNYNSAVGAHNPVAKECLSRILTIKKKGVTRNSETSFKSLRCEPEPPFAT